MAYILDLQNGNISFFGKKGYDEKSLDKRGKESN